MAGGSSPTPIATKKAVGFAGVPGVGVSTLAFHVALAWADWSRCKTVLLTLDFESANRFQGQLGIAGTQSVLDLQATTTSVPFSTTGLGILPLGKNESALKALSPEFLKGLLDDLKSHYNVVLDFGPEIGDIHRPSSHFGRSLLMEIEHGFWVVDPHEDNIAERNIPALNALAREFVQSRLPSSFSTVFNHKQRADEPWKAGTEALRQVLPQHTNQVRRLPAYDLTAGIAEALRVDMSIDFHDFMDLLRRVGGTDDETMVTAISRQMGIPYASFENKILKMEHAQGLEKLIPRSFAKEHAVVPLFLDEGILAIAMANPDDLSLIQAMGEMTGRTIQPFIARDWQIFAEIERGYPRSSAGGIGGNAS
ncbi:MAG: hypothetical protein HZB91_08285 [Elusimicrobia bacterium]|nr:hypothetical protein [Elusimicrobiota bacterium]